MKPATFLSPSLFLLLLLAGLLHVNPAQANSVTYSSAEARNTLLELYTSEGCSSCPPAERWLSKLQHDPHLWKTLFPVAFHVDYWNDLGWKDIYSDARHSRRQQTYASYGYASTVYTPGFFRNGREWRGYFKRGTLDPNGSDNVGKLSATVSPRKIEVAFEPAVDIYASQLNIAVLGFNKTMSIRAGENAGKVLRHDFVVLAHQQYSSNDNHWQVTDETILNQIERGGGAIVLWVAQENNPTPIQTVGGWLVK